MRTPRGRRRSSRHAFRLLVPAVLASAGLLLAACSGPSDDPNTVPIPTTTVTVTVTATPSPTQSTQRPRPEPTRTATPTPTRTSAAGSGSYFGSSLNPGEFVSESGIVTYVVDGDTIDVAGVGRVRFQGIDTPERGECGFGPATSAMQRLVLGKRADLISFAGAEDSDRYGRLLRYVQVDGVDTGLALIERGLAIARYDSRDGYGAHPRESLYVSTDAATDPASKC